MANDTVSLKKYIGIFAAIYTALHIILMGGMYVFDAQDGNFMNMPMLFASAFFASHFFVKDQRRVFSKGEVRRLSMMCTLTSGIASLFVYSLVVLFDPNLSLGDISDVLERVPASSWIVGIVVVSLLYYFMLVLFYGPITKKFFSKN